MATLNVNVPRFYCFLRQEFLYDGETHHGELVHVCVFGAASIHGRALGFHVLTENGAVIWRLPLHVFCHKPETPVQPPGWLQFWDCFSYEMTVTVFERLQDSRVRVQLKDRSWEGANTCSPSIGVRAKTLKKREMEDTNARISSRSIMATSRLSRTIAFSGFARPLSRRSRRNRITWRIPEFGKLSAKPKQHRRSSTTLSTPTQGSAKFRSTLRDCARLVSVAVILGESFNGRTAGLQPANEGSIPSSSTKFAREAVAVKAPV